MSKQLSNQAAELWKTISAPQTAEAYKSALLLTGQIIKRLFLTIWLMLCLAVVAADWLASMAIRSGSGLRSWVKKLQQQDSEKLALVTGEQLVAVSKQSLAQAVANARQQLGLPEKSAPRLMPVTSEATAADSDASKA